MKYRVYLDRIISGTIEVEADTKELASKAALDEDAGGVDWSDDPDSQTIAVCDVTELDEMGDEID